MTDSLSSRPVRLPAAALFAIATTFGLFWLMQALVAIELGELPPPGRELRVDIVRLKREPPPPVPPKPSGPVKPEPAPMPPSLGPSDGIRDAIPIPNPFPAGPEEWAGPEVFRGAAQAITPIVRVDPDYPPHAEQRGIGGWVEIAFTVNAAGQVREARVLDASPPGVFEANALRAVQRWRYRPRTEGGNPVPTQERVRLQFRPHQR